MCQCQEGQNLLMHVLIYSQFTHDGIFQLAQDVMKTCQAWYCGASPSTILLCSLRLISLSMNERSVEELSLQSCNEASSDLKTYLTSIFVLQHLCTSVLDRICLPARLYLQPACSFILQCLGTENSLPFLGHNMPPLPLCSIETNENIFFYKFLCLYYYFSVIHSIELEIMAELCLSCSFIGKTIYKNTETLSDLTINRSVQKLLQRKISMFTFDHQNTGQPNIKFPNKKI